MTDFGVYFIITKPRLPYGTLAEVCVERDIRFIQLREKDLSDREILAAAREIRGVTKGTETGLIMNDRADLAGLADADGLHLGQDDISPEQGALIFPGEDKIRGISTHSPEQARSAWEKHPHYIGFGPVFPTPTKKIPDPAVGTETLGRIIRESPVPVVAIGGLFPENLDRVIRSGARNVCLVRHFMECRSRKELDERIGRVQALLREAV